MNALIRPSTQNSSANYLFFRSASRVGFLDFGVNAKRVNWYAPSHFYPRPPTMHPHS